MFFRCICPIVCAFLAVTFGPVFASGDVLYSSEFTRMQIGARQMALGDAGVALPLNALAAYWNPAAQSFLETFEVWAEGAQLYGGLSSQGALAFEAPIQDGLNAAVIYNSFWPHEIYEYDSLPADYATRLNQPELRADGAYEGVFRNNHHMLIMSIAKRYGIPFPRPASLSIPIPVDLGVGLNVKYYWQTMDPGGKTRMGMNLNLDAGLLLRIGVDFDVEKQKIVRQVCLAADIRNVVPSRMVWVNSPADYGERVDNSQYYGVAYIDDAGLGWLTWKVALSVNRTPGEISGENGKIGLVNTRHYGLEFGILDCVDIRAGVSDGIVGLGAGVHYRAYRLDYLFKFDRIELSALRLALGVRF